MYVYIHSETNIDTGMWLYTVGFYDPKGEWIPESDQETREKAAERCHYLNGGDKNA